jgi:hypothetical protein
LFVFLSFLFNRFYRLGGGEWGCTTGNAATVARRTKKKQAEKDSVIEGQPLLLFL